MRNPSYEHTQQWRTNPPVWAAWTFDPAEWTAFDAWDLAQARRAAWVAFRRTLYSHGAAHSEIRVPVPQDQVAAAEELAARFDAQVIG